MKLIIAGSRSITDMKVLGEALRKIRNERVLIDEVVCGMARGADQLGEEWADSAGIPVVKFPADWNKHGKSAGVIRNIEMAKYADGLLALWDGKSAGTANMILEAHRKGLKVWVSIVDIPSK